MNSSNDITDGEFVPFLQSLGVDTCKSFEWMLNDPDFAGVLRWIYNSLDHNNALTAREEYRYNEIKKRGALLSPDDLDAAVASIQDQYPGICLPGDQESKEDLELDVHFQEERLHMLEKQEIIVRDLIRQNEAIKDELTLELTHLNSALRQCTEDEGKAAEDCTALALEVDNLMDELADGIADSFEVYACCKGNKDIAKRFIIFSPLETYRQSQALLRSHHELFVSKHFGNQLNLVTEELRTASIEARNMEKSTFSLLEMYRQSQALMRSDNKLYAFKHFGSQLCLAAEKLWTASLEARNMEQRLSDAALAYVKSKADLSGEQAKLSLISKYNDVHPSQLTDRLLETQSALELLEQEEGIMEQEVRNAVEELVTGRTELAVGTAMQSALEVRQQIHTSLSHLVDVWQRAFALDRILYYSLRHELRTLEEFVQFAAELRTYAIEETNAVASRIEYMNEIVEEQSACSHKLETTTPLLQALCSILGLPLTTDSSVLVKAYNDLQGNLRELRENLQDSYRKKENALVEFNSSARPLRAYVWSGCTRRAHGWDRGVASLSHALKQHMAGVDRRVADATEMFTRVKNGDKQNLRKLWQWFLTDPPRFLSAVENCSF